MFLIWKVHSKYNNHYTTILPVEDRAVRKRESSRIKPKTNFKSAEPAFRIENREKKSRELDGRSSCTSECLSSLVSSTCRSRAGVDVAGTLARGSLYTSTGEPERPT
jgi:hypothetical protein